MAVVWIILIIEMMSYALVGYGQCTSGTNIVPVCTNSSISYTQMYIPVNGGMADGCICDVTMVKYQINSGSDKVNVSNVVNGSECGYKVVNYNTPDNDSWTCSNNEEFRYPLKLNESFELKFTSDSTPEPTSTGFCLQLTTIINGIVTNNTFTITCWRNDNTSTQEKTTPSNTITTSPNVSVGSLTTISPTTISPDVSVTSLTTTATNPTTSANVPVTTSTRKSTPTSPVTPPQIASARSSTMDGSTSTSSDSSGYGSTEKVAGIPDAVIIGGGAAGACLLLIIIIVIIVCLIKRRKNNQYHKPSTRTNVETGYEDIHPEQPIMMENNEDSQRTQGRPNSNNADQKRTQMPDEMIYLENELYVSADSFLDNSTPTSRSPTSPDYTDIDDFPGRKPDKVQAIPPANVAVDNNPNVNNVYAVVNKKPKTERTDNETNNHKDENQPHTFSVGQSPISNNTNAVVSKPPKNEKKDNSCEDPNHQASVHNGDNPTELLSVSETPNPNNVYAVVNKKPKVTDKPSKPEPPPKPGKPPKPEKAVKPRVPTKPSTKL